MKNRLIGAGFQAFQATRLDRLVAPLTQGIGAILTFHHVRPARRPEPGFSPNGILEITPDFLETVLKILRRGRFDIVDMDTALDILAGRRGQGRRPFVVLTFDDGYRDNAEYATPILKRHDVPYMLYVTTGFAQRTARLWWRELEYAIARAPSVELDGIATNLTMPAATADEKTQAFSILYKHLRAGPEARLLAVIADLAHRYGIDSRQLVEEACMTFDEIAELARDPLCTIGAHTVSHPMLAKHDADVVRHELADSKREIEARIGRPVRHVSYPVGDPTSAGPREFLLARDLGYSSGVTTRPGMIFPCHADHALALPRVSINGRWQSVSAVETLLSGAPFAFWNAGRRLNVA